jgi:tellurite methyltransferase
LSDLDRKKWNSRYAEGAYARRTHPSRLLVDALQDWPEPSGRALDIACGAGRNALYLAERGFQVTGLDSSDQALDRARRTAADHNLTVQWREQDLDELTELNGPYALICMVRYVNVPLLRLAAQCLVPGGLLVVEQHLRTDPGVIGPQNPAFRLAPGELGQQLADLEMVEHWEGDTEDPDGRPVALARAIARCPD